MSDAPAAELERLAGLVERVTFHNEQNGFCVLRLKVKGERELITLVGHTPIVSPGEYASASGHWVTVVGFEGDPKNPTHFLVNDPDTGAQLRLTRAELERHSAAHEGIWMIPH